MKTLIFILAYFLVGLVCAIMASKAMTKERGFSYESFDEMDNLEIAEIVIFFAFWPIMLIFAAIDGVAHLVFNVTNRNEHDGGKL